MNEPSAQTKICWGLVAALLLVVACRLPYIDRPFNDEDVAQIAYSASRALDGQLLYRDTMEGKPGLVLAVFVFAFRVLGETMTSVNVVALAFALATTWLVFQLTDLLFGRRAATFAALFYAVFSNSNTVNGNSPNYDFWMLPFMVAALYCFVKGQAEYDEGVDVWTCGRMDENVHTSTHPHVHTSTQSRFWLLTAGVCSGLAVLCKQHALFNFVVLLNYLFFMAWRDPSQRKPLLGRLMLLGVGFTLPWLPFVFYYWMRGGLSDYIGTLASTRTTTGYLGSRTWGHTLHAAYVQLTRQITRDTLLWIFAMAGLIHLAVGETESKRQPGHESTAHCSLLTVHCSLLLWLWAFWSLVGVSIARRFYDHYFQQMIPVFSVLSGYACGLCFHKSDWRTSLKHAPSLALLTAMLFGFVLSSRFHLQQTLRQAKRIATGQRELNDSEKIGAYLRAHSSPNDYVFVACFKPDVYYYAQRKSPTKWWEEGFKLGLWSLMAQDFEKHKPKFIVFSGRVSGLPEFQDFVRRHYEPATQISEFQILRLRPALVRDAL